MADVTRGLDQRVNKRRKQSQEAKKTAPQPPGLPPFSPSVDLPSGLPSVYNDSSQFNQQPFSPSSSGYSDQSSVFSTPSRQSSSATSYSHSSPSYQPNTSLPASVIGNRAPVGGGEAAEYYSSPTPSQGSYSSVIPNAFASPQQRPYPSPQQGPYSPVPPSTYYSAPLSPHPWIPQPPGTVVQEPASYEHPQPQPSHYPQSPPSLQPPPLSQSSSPPQYSPQYSPPQYSPPQYLPPPQGTPARAPVPASTTNWFKCEHNKWVGPGTSNCDYCPPTG
ncbi:hypothetical protein AOQ84DRAFT_441757 [Glonium stellatum]|uniref:Uncharacterized protein n=1 Tax=Glonium stellatum TaxID=574774 RepID=A0A8E2EUR2_9PEZI|nr:hypothetical protein AOQ84DRAFT_441757 [Glonium stellatum]